MKERITYIIRDPIDGFDPSTLDITTSSLRVEKLDGAKEHQITFGLEELPAEIRDLLTSTHELHIRWSTSTPYDALAPFISRTPAGLHVFYSPLSTSDGSNQLDLCPSLKKAFGGSIKCEHGKSFTTPPILSERFAHSASRQFYAYVATPATLVEYLTRSVCTTSSDDCRMRARELEHADALDFDYDSISHALIVKALWSKPYSHGSWSETSKLSADGALEVGILINEREDEVEELRYSGFLTQVGKDAAYAPTLFSFPARHHPLPSTSSFSTKFLEPTGLHPTLQVSIPIAATTPPQPKCHLHTYLTLPSAVFIDRYPLSDPLFLASHNLKALRALSGATDLEAPDYVTPAWGSAALFEIATSSAPDSSNPRAAEKDFKVTIPLHSRYLPPVANASGISHVPIPDPVVFWACQADAGSQFPSSPFERVNLGYEGLFGVKTMFYHFSPLASNVARSAGGSSGAGRGAGLVQHLPIPVLDLDKAWYVEWGTVLAVLVGALLVAVPLISVVVKDFKVRWNQFSAERSAGSSTKGQGPKVRKS